MVFIERNKGDVAKPESAKKIIKSADFWAFKCASGIIDSANSDREKIILEAHAAYEKEKIRGYKDGRDQAKFEQSANMIAIVSQTVDYFSKVEAQMVDLVLEAVQKIISNYTDREQVFAVVKSSLALVRNQTMITVKVHPTQCEYFTENLEKLKSEFPTIEYINLTADASLDHDACIVESEVGRVESSMHAQINALHMTLKKVFGAQDQRRSIASIDAEQMEYLKLEK